MQDGLRSFASKCIGLYTLPEDEDEAAEAVRAALDQRTVLRIDGAQLDVDALIAACDMLEGNLSITTLEVHHCSLSGSDALARRLADVLQGRTALRKLDLSENDMTNRGARPLIKALEHNHTVHELDVTLNKLGADIWSWMKGVLLKNPSLVAFRAKEYAPSYCGGGESHITNAADREAVQRGLKRNRENLRHIHAEQLNVLLCIRHGELYLPVELVRVVLAMHESAWMAKLTLWDGFSN